MSASLYDELRDRLVAKTRTLIAGDPKDEKTFIGPMIDVKEATRLDNWIQAAAAGGAKVLCGGKRDGAMLEATLIEGVGRDAKLYAEIEASGEFRMVMHQGSIEVLQRVRPPGKGTHPITVP